MICEPQTGRVLHKVLMSPDLAVEAIRWARAHGRHLVLFADGQLWVEELRYPPDLYDRWMRLPLQETSALDAAILSGQVRCVLKFIDLVPEAEQPSPSAISAWRAALADRLQVVRSHPRFIEITPLDVTKGRALAWLADTWQIPSSQVIAVGDAENDLSMIEWAGLGVAMGQAAAHVRAAADWVAPSVDEDGVAAVVARFILNGMVHG
jgi:Cof subfamily protein (haloacid dehalogenase superfamily)